MRLAMTRGIRFAWSLPPLAANTCKFPFAALSNKAHSSFAASFHYTTTGELAGHSSGAKSRLAVGKTTGFSQTPEKVGGGVIGGRGGHGLSDCRLVVIVNLGCNRGPFRCDVSCRAKGNGCCIPFLPDAMPPLPGPIMPGEHPQTDRPLLSEPAWGYD